MCQALSWASRQSDKTPPPKKPGLKKKKNHGLMGEINK